MRILQTGKRLGAFGTAVAVIETQNHFFDYILYPATIVWLGAVKGGILMTVAALAMNYLIVVWYNKTRQDWFGLEWLRFREKSEAQTITGGILRLLLMLGKWPSYVLISIYDPAYGFIFLRGRESRGWSISRTDWVWFVISNLIGNLAWILVLTGVIEGVRFVA
jgi:hypothetical protein